MPKISVIVPVYNVEKYLGRCIDSILNQTFRDFELILVDDGSPDKCGEICDDYAKKDDRIKVIHKKNGGLSDSRNVGIDIARGECISFIDSDDWIHADFLNTLYSNMKEDNVDIAVVGFHKEWDNKKEQSIVFEKKVYFDKSVMNEFYSPEIPTHVNIAWNKLYKKELFENIRYPVGRIHEDGFTTYKLFYNANGVSIASDDLYYYYQRENSIMNEKFSVKRIDEYFVYIERECFFIEHNLYELMDLNYKTRFSCIKTLTMKIINSNLDKKTKKEYLKLFKNDVKKNFNNMASDKKIANRIGNFIYKVSPECFYYFSKLKHGLNSILR